MIETQRWRSSLVWFHAAWLLAMVGCDRGGSERRVVVRQGEPYAPAFSRHFSGSADEQIRDVAVGPDGTIYVCGGSASSDLPTSLPRYPIPDGKPADDPAVEPYDVFVAAMRPSGETIWSRRIGGPNYDRAYAIEIGADGFIYVAGRAGRGFPVTPNVVQERFAGGREPLYGEQDGFVLKLAPGGAEVVWSTYFGGSDAQIVRDLDLGPRGEVYLAAAYESGEWFEPIGAAFVNQPGGGRDTVAACIEPDGTALCWARYLGGSRLESGSPSIRYADGSVVVVTATRSPDYPVTPGAWDTSFNGAEDMLVARLGAAGGEVFWATYLGGSETEGTETHSVAIDGAGNVYVAGGTESDDFPTTPEAVQRTFGGIGGYRSGWRTNYTGDMFVAKLSADGARLLASTYLGGRLGEGLEGIAIDQAGNVVISGASYSPDFPVTSRCARGVSAGGADFVAAKLSADLDRLLYATYFGGSKLDFGRSIASGPDGALIVAGQSRSQDWLAIGPIGTAQIGGWDAAVVRLAPVPGASR